MQKDTDKNKKAALKPFVKWAGGKGQLLEQIRAAYPAGLGDSVTKYCEPFVGGGAVLFDVLSRYDLDEVYISDVNAELIHVYRTIQGGAEALIARLSALQAEYLPLDTKARAAYYYDRRAEYNALKTQGAQDTNSAALFIFLNRTCFNGLYRVNRQGLFNVPVGAYKNPAICDEANLRALSAALRNVRIFCGDYRESRGFVDAHTFVYIDPPYRPLTATASFTAYMADAFGDDQQRQLAAYVDALDALGAKVIVSNSDPKNADETDDFFDDIYGRHRIRRVQASRMINSNAEQRGKISELLITNDNKDGQ